MRSDNSHKLASQMKAVASKGLFYHYTHVSIYGYYTLLLTCGSKCQKRGLRLLLCRLSRLIQKFSDTCTRNEEDVQLEIYGASYISRSQDTLLSARSKSNAVAYFLYLQTDYQRRK